MYPTELSNFSYYERFTETLSTYKLKLHEKCNYNIGKKAYFEENVSVITSFKFAISNYLIRFPIIQRKQITKTYLIGRFKQQQRINIIKKVQFNFSSSKYCVGHYIKNVHQCYHQNTIFLITEMSGTIC